MSSSNFILEDFDTLSPEKPKSADYCLGYEAGKLDALAAAQQSQAVAIGEVAASLEDMAFTLVEAQTLIENMLRPLIIQLAETALPSILQDSFGAHLMDVVMSGFDNLKTEPVTVRLGPDVASTLEEAVPPEIIARFNFEHDPLLEPGQALLTQKNKDILIDLPALSQELQRALLGLASHERTESNG